MSTPDDIRRDIDETRAGLSDDVNALTDKMKPGNAARSAVSSVKEKVMGSGGDGPGIASRVSDAPDAVKSRAQGTPLAAGLLAFAAGWLVSSLIPASEAETSLAGTVKDKVSENSEALTAPAKQAAQEMKENLQGPAQEAVGAVKEKATDAGQKVKDHAESERQDLTDDAKDAASELRSQSSS